MRELLGKAFARPNITDCILWAPRLGQTESSGPQENLTSQEHNPDYGIMPRWVCTDVLMRKDWEGHMTPHPTMALYWVQALSSVGTGMKGMILEAISCQASQRTSLASRHGACKGESRWTKSVWGFPDLKQGARSLCIYEAGNAL